MNGTQNNKTFFDGDKLQPSEAFVLWLDIMGTKNTMSRSLMTSANFVFKFHTVMEMNKTDGISICPVMDGAYVAAQDSTTMRKFIHDVFVALCNDFVQEEKYQRQYMVRGSLAYGEVVLGQSMSSDCFDNRVRNASDWPAYQKSLIIGAPVIQAFSREQKVPPFGVYIHESACAHGFAFTSKWHTWWKGKGGEVLSDDQTLIKDLKEKVGKYFQEYEKHSYSFSYSTDRINEHRVMFEDYISL
jgi:hypothetical protein